MREFNFVFDDDLKISKSNFGIINDILKFVKNELLKDNIDYMDFKVTDIRNIFSECFTSVVLEFEKISFRMDKIWAKNRFYVECFDDIISFVYYDNDDFTVTCDTIFESINLSFLHELYTFLADSKEEMWILQNDFEKKIEHINGKMVITFDDLPLKSFLKFDNENNILVFDSIFSYFFADIREGFLNNLGFFSCDFPYLKLSKIEISYEKMLVYLNKIDPDFKFIMEYSISEEKFII